MHQVEKKVIKNKIMLLVAYTLYACVYIYIYVYIQWRTVKISSHIVLYIYRNQNGQMTAEDSKDFLLFEDGK